MDIGSRECRHFHQFGQIASPKKFKQINFCTDISVIILKDFETLSPQSCTKNAKLLRSHFKFRFFLVH